MEELTRKKDDTRKLRIGWTPPPRGFWIQELFNNCGMGGGGGRQIRAQRGHQHFGVLNGWNHFFFHVGLFSYGEADNFHTIYCHKGGPRRGGGRQIRGRF